MNCYQILNTCFSHPRSKVVMNPALNISKIVLANDRYTKLLELLPPGNNRQRQRYGRGKNVITLQEFCWQIGGKPTVTGADLCC